MANLINGKLSSEPMAKLNIEGEYQRPESGFCEWPHEAVVNRYHLYVSYACPWAHRTLIVRNIKKLQDIITVSIVDPYMGKNGWTFKDKSDPQLLAFLYTTTERLYTGKVTVPVLWDKKEKRILNNDSSEIIRIFNTAFDELTDSTIDLYPEHLRGKIDSINGKIYQNVNNGVYQAGFAGTQRVYERAFDDVFRMLDEIELLLGNQRYLAGDFFTEADVRLFTTLIRFDTVYFDHIKEHYYRSHDWINPTGIVPKGPVLNIDWAHERGPVMYWMKNH